MNSKLPWKIRKHFIEDADGDLVVNFNDLQSEYNDADKIVEAVNNFGNLKNKYYLCLQELDKVYKENNKLKEEIDSLNMYIKHGC